MKLPEHPFFVAFFSGLAIVLLIALVCTLIILIG